ncbi:retrotransposon protein, putative, ty1-copia subclass [Tanacetum coccineum]
MGGSSLQPHTEKPMSPTRAFPTRDMYSPEYSNTFQQTDSFQHTAREDSPVELAAPPPKWKSKPTKGRQKRTAQNEDALRQTALTNEEEIVLCKGWVHVSENSKKEKVISTPGNAKDLRDHLEKLFYDNKDARAINLDNELCSLKIGNMSNNDYCTELKYMADRLKNLESPTSGSSSFNRKSGDASINLNVDVGDDKEDEVQELRRPMGRDKAKGLKKKGARSSRLSSSTNDEVLARLMFSELAMHNQRAIRMKKEKCLAFLEIKRREVECRERELKMQEISNYNASSYGLVRFVDIASIFWGSGIYPRWASFVNSFTVTRDEKIARQEGARKDVERASGVLQGRYTTTGASLHCQHQAKQSSQVLVCFLYTTVMAIQGGRVQKYKPQGKAKGKGKDGQCHHAKRKGHEWKGPVYLAEGDEKKKKNFEGNLEEPKKLIAYGSNYGRLTRTPYELWHGKVPKLSYLKVGVVRLYGKVKRWLYFNKELFKYTFLVYGGNPEAELRVNCYCDAEFKTDRDDTKSQTSCKKLGIQKGARHLKRKYHYVRECIETGEINIVKVHTDDNLVDLFTKALASPKLTRHARSIGLRPASSFM